MQQKLTYVWIDLECSGLDETVDDIFEFGVIGTTEDLTTLYTQRIVVRASETALARADSNPFVRQMMADNGLRDELIAGGDTLPTIGEAEQYLLAAIDRHSTAGTLILAGSGVTHYDLRFLKHHTPTLAARFHDREVLDVGILRRAFKRATGQDLTEANTGKNHRADVDIACHLEEGRSYFSLFQQNAPKNFSISEPSPRM